MFIPKIIKSYVKFRQLAILLISIMKNSIAKITDTLAPSFKKSSAKPWPLIIMSIILLSVLYPSIITHAQPYTFDYAAYGFPAPQNPNPVLSDAKYTNFKALWNSYMGVQAAKVGKILGIDPGMIGGWTLHEQIQSTFFDNCNGSNYDPNTVCKPGLAWQVGYGVIVMDNLGNLEEAMAAMHPSETVTQVGNNVVAASKTRDTKYPLSDSYRFPDGITISEMINDKNDDTTRIRLGILMKDDAIGTYLAGKVIKGYMALGTGMAAKFQKWVPSYYVPQDVSNSFDAAYKAGISSSSGQACSSTTPADNFLAIYRETTFYEPGVDINCGSSTGGVQQLADIASEEYEKNKGNLAFGSDNVAFSGSDYSNGVAEDWCADFVSWVYKQAGLSFTGGENGGWRIPGVPSLIAYFQNRQTFIAVSPEAEPKPGDLIFHTSTPGDGTTGTHVQIVIDYNISAKTITYVGGNEDCQVNTSGCRQPNSYNSELAKRTITLDNQGRSGDVMGYGRQK